MRLKSMLFCLLTSFGTGVALADTVVLNAEDGWYPYSGVVDGKLQGFAVDMIAAAYKSVGVEAKFEQKPYARCTDEVLKGKMLACFDTTRQANLENDYLWHETPMFKAKILIWGHADSKESNLTPKDIEGKSVGTTLGYEYGDTVDKNPKIIKTESADDTSLLNMLAAKRITYALVFEKVGFAVIQQNEAALKGKVKPVGEVWVSDLYLSFSKTFKDSPKYLKLFEEGYKKITVDGTFARLEKEWDAKLGR